MDRSRNIRLFFFLSFSWLVCLPAHAAPDIAISDSLVAFGPVFIGDTAADTIVVSNLGDDVLTVRLFMAFPILEDGFVVDMTPFELLAGESRNVEVTYSPTHEGPVAGEFTLASNDPDESAVDVALSGKGVSPPEIVFTVEVAVTAQDASDLHNTLGTNAGATDGYDGLLDLPERPPAPGKYVTGYFPDPGMGRAGGRPVHVRHPGSL